MPTRGRVRCETAYALRPYAPSFAQDKYGIASLRNWIVRKFLSGTCDALVMVDDDVVPPAGFVEALAEADGFDVIGGTYMIGVESVFLSAAWKQDQGAWAMTESDSGQPEPVDVVGTGCVLIHRRVLEDPKMAAPFATRQDEHGITVDGEDVSFCMRAGELGYRLGMHWGVVCEHVIDGLYATEIRTAYETALLTDMVRAVPKEA